eukprot:PhM_4_TR10848/c0_g2_i1/m.67704/K10599/PRPF19, PRP19; pre-mRNA-processing factor 19
MSLTCSLSHNKIGPGDAVVANVRTGNIFSERALREYLVANNNRSPEVTNNNNNKSNNNNNPTTVTLENDFVKLLLDTTTASPAPPPACDIPSLLSIFQSEWTRVQQDREATARHIEVLRKENARLVHAYDAACRVIDALRKEREHLVIQNDIVATMDTPTSPTTTTTHNKTILALPNSVSDRITRHEGELATARRNAATTATHFVSYNPPRLVAEAIRVRDGNLATAHTLLLPATTRSSHVAAVGASDGTVTLLVGHVRLTGDEAARDNNSDDDDIHSTISSSNNNNNNVSCSSENNENNNGEEAPTRLRSSNVFVGHAKRVSRLTRVCDGVVASGGEDSTVRVWKYNAVGDNNNNNVLRAHTGSITGLAAHPGMENVLVSTGLDGVVCVHDAAVMRTIARVPTMRAISSFDLHPDGALVAVGATAAGATINLMDLRRLPGCLAEVPLSASSSPLAGVNFLDSGYHMVAAQEDGTVTLFDLRRHPVATVDRTNVSSGTGVASLGTVVRVAGLPHAAAVVVAGANGVHVHAVRPSWEPLHRVANPYAGYVVDVCSSPMRVGAGAFPFPSWWERAVSSHATALPSPSLRVSSPGRPRRGSVVTLNVPSMFDVANGSDTPSPGLGSRRTSLTSLSQQRGSQLNLMNNNNKNQLMTYSSPQHHHKGGSHDVFSVLSSEGHLAIYSYI